MGSIINGLRMNLISDRRQRLVFDNVSLSDVGVYSVRITSGESGRK